MSKTKRSPYFSCGGCKSKGWPTMNEVRKEEISQIKAAQNKGYVIGPTGEKIKIIKVSKQLSKQEELDKLEGTKIVRPRIRKFNFFEMLWWNIKDFFKIK